MAFDPLHYRFTQAAIGSPEDDAATAAAAAVAQTQLSQVALQKGILVVMDEVLTVLETGVSVTATQVDDSPFTVGSSTVQPAAGIYKSSRDAVNDGDAGALAMNEKRGLYVTLEASDSTPLALAAGAVSAATLRTITASDDAGVTSLAIIDDWDESDRAKVNLIVGQAGIAAGAGAVGVTVPRVTLASDDPAVTALQIIDDWDETDRAKVNLIVGQAGIAAGAGAVGVTVPRVTHASDDPVTTAVQIMDDWDESDRAKVNPIVGQAGVAAGAGAVGVTVQRVTLASDDPAVSRLTGPTTGTQTSVNDTASDTTILASNASRKGATVFNDSTAVLYLLLSNATSSSTAHTVQIQPGGYYELPFSQGGVYTGIIKGIWASDAAGAARVTELT